LSLNRVFRGSLWLYLSGIASSFLGYVYWLLASSFVPPSTIGDAAAVIGIVSLITSVFSFGAASGATRMLGKAVGHGDQKSVNNYLSSSLVFSLSVYMVTAVGTFFLGNLFNITRLDIVFTSVLIVLGGWPSILTSFYYSTLRTNIIALASILSAMLRLILGIAFLYIGLGFVGVMAAFIVASIIQDSVLILMMKGKISLTRPGFVPTREVLRAGIADWIPSLVATAGTWLGILGIYSFSGSQQTGTYYIAFMVASLVYALPTSIFGLMFPVLSGMEDGRKRATNRSIRLALAITVPLAALGLAYPYVPLSLLGSSYVASSVALQVLLIGTLIAPITSGLNSLVYAYGKYRYVTLLGLSMNIPRVVLYAFLVALWGENGVAFSFILGYFFALGAALLISKKIGFTMGWRSSVPLMAIPLIMAPILYIVNIHWVLGVLVMFGVSAVLYTRLGLITRADLAELASAFMSREQLDSLSPYTSYILQLLYGK
jgi:O-antigen/teichoic acid export membrane protein